VFPRIKNYFLRAKWYLLVCLLTIPTIVALFRPGFFPMHDDISALRIDQMQQCFHDLQLPCLWSPDMGYGYGYPQFEYYGPLPYYMMTLGHSLGLSLFASVKLGFILPMVLGSLAMFLLASTLFGNWGGLLSTMAYAYAPYRASDLYSRGAMGEHWAFIFMPLILFALVRLFKKPNLRTASLLALSYAGLLVTHNITTLIFTPMVAVLALFLLFISTKKRKFIKFGLFGLIWSVLIAGFFLIPVVLEKDYAHTESLIEGYFNYLAHFATIKQLLFTTFWGYGSSEIGPTDDLSFFVGPVQLLLFILSLLIVLKEFRNKKTLPFYLVIASTIFMTTSLFMAHQKSTFIWKLVPVLAFLQFPWRFLITANFFLTLVAGYSLKFLQGKKAFLLASVMIFFLIFFNVSFFRPRDWYDLSIYEKFSGQSWDSQLTRSIFDYLPIFAKFPPGTPAPQYPYAANRTPVGILDYVHRSNSISFNSNTQKNITLVLPQFFFPGWRVTIDNRTVPINYKNDLGLISFDLPPGTHLVRAHLGLTPVRLVGDLMTLIAFPAAFYILTRKKYENS